MNVKKRILDLMTIVGLLFSGAAVVDLALRWDSPVLNVFYYIWGGLCAALLAYALLFRRGREDLKEAASGGSRLLWLRVLLAAVLFLLGWYINAASVKLYGEESEMVRGNGARMFALIFTLILHVLYFGYTHRKPDGETPPKHKLI